MSTLLLLLYHPMSILYSLPPSSSPSPPSGSTPPLLSSPLLPLSLTPSLPPSVSSTPGDAPAENCSATGCSLENSLGVLGLGVLQLAPGRAGWQSCWGLHPEGPLVSSRLASFWLLRPELTAVREEAYAVRG